LRTLSVNPRLVATKLGYADSDGPSLTPVAFGCIAVYGLLNPCPYGTESPNATYRPPRGPQVTA
jgi:hypothetical protein